MTVNLRTVLKWLDEQRIHDEAECWILTGDTVEPITYVTWTNNGDIILTSAPPWHEPTPIPLHYAQVCAMLLEHYSGGGLLKWSKRPRDTYRGSYIVNPESSVFFIFLSSTVGVVEDHETKMEQKKQQAIQLTRQIQESQQWPI
jgi:hypothetical protein